MGSVIALEFTNANEAIPMRYNSEISCQMSRILRFPLVVLVLVVLALVTAPSSWAKTLNIGTISATPVAEVRIFQPFADYLAGELAHDGVDAVRVIIAADIYHMAELLKTGEADLFVDSSITALAVNKLSGSQYMLRRWKKGRAQYRSVIFVSDDSAIASLADLKDKVIAFEEPFSTSGFMLPALTAHGAGLDLVAVNNTSSTPPAGQVGYVMALDNETQATWVERDRVQAAAMAEDDFNDFAKTSLKPLRVLRATPFVPYHVMIHRPGLEASLVERIKMVLKTAHETDRGRKILKDFERTTKFDEIPPGLLLDVMKFEPSLNLLISPK